jgi:hypothetical protein
MKTFQFSKALIVLLVLTLASFSAFANESTVKSANQIERVEIGAQDNPRVSPLSKRYKKAVRMEKRDHQSAIKKAKRKMLQRILGKKWRQLWSKQF